MQNRRRFLALLALAAGAPRVWAEAKPLVEHHSRRNAVKRIPSIILAATLAAFAGSLAYAADSSMHDMNRMKGESGHAHATASASYSGAGTIKSVDKSAGKVSIAHGPIAPLQWPAMTMTFVVKDPRLLDGVASGQKVDFAFVQQGSQYVVTALR